MIVECPNCTSTFNLDDGLVRPEGVKVRCTVCEHVFVVTPESGAAAPEEPVQEQPVQEEQGHEQAAPPEPSGPDEPEMGLGDGNLSLNLDETQKKKGRAKGGMKKMAVMAAVLLLLLAAGAGALYFFVPGLIPGLGERPVAEAPAGTEGEGAAQVNATRPDEPSTAGTETTAKPPETVPDVQNIVLADIRQYYVDNDKAGRIFVVEGQAVNEFEEPKAGITVEVQLLDAQGVKLTGKTFMAGNTLDLYGLQNLSREKIEEGLADPVGVAENNAQVEPGRAVPFMVVFFDSPAGVREFLVKVTGVKNPS